MFFLSFSSTVYSVEDLAAAATVPPAVSEAASTASSNADSNESSFDKAKALQQYVELNSKTVSGITEKTTHSELLSILSAAGKSINVPEVGQVILTSANPECKAIVTPNATQVWAKAVLADVPDVSEMIGTYLCQGITAGYTPVDEVTLKAFAEGLPGVCFFYNRGLWSLIDDLKLVKWKISGTPSMAPLFNIALRDK